MKNKKKITTFDIPITFEPMVGMGGGFRTDWVSGSGKGISFGLESGAGLGNPLLTFWIEKKNKRDYYTADIQVLARAILAKLDI